MKNDLQIAEPVALEVPGKYREAFLLYDVTKALVIDHWSILSRFYVRNYKAFQEEADRAYSPRGEKLRNTLASLN
jgi:hypothetical protein